MSSPLGDAAASATSCRTSYHANAMAPSQHWCKEADDVFEQLADLQKQVDLLKRREAWHRTAIFMALTCIVCLLVAIAAGTAGGDNNMHLSWSSWTSWAPSQVKAGSYEVSESMEQLRAALNRGKEAGANFAFPKQRQLASSGSTENSSSTETDHHSDHEAHPHDALLYLFNAFILGTIVLHATVLPALHSMQTTVVLFLLGLVYALVHNALHLEDHLGVLGRSHTMWMEIDPHLILFTLLPALLGGDSLAIDTSIAKRVAGQCIWLAGPGVAVGASLTALFLKYFLDWPFYLALTTGAILSATDPVAVVGLLKQLGGPPTLTIQIAGESLLNDGAAIVLFSLAYAVLEGDSFTASEVVIFVVKKALCACLLGWGIGWLFSLWISAASDRFEHHSSTIQISLTLCCAYWSFFLAEGVLDMSGVLCTVVACFVLADSIWLAVLDKASMQHVWHMFEFLGNTIIFFLAGALTGDSMHSIPFTDYLNLVVIYLVCMVIRAFVIFGSRPILKYVSADNEPVPCTEAIVMTWGGLRGAVGLALAIQVRADRAGGEISEMDAKRVLFYTGGVAMLTMVINATTCPMLVKALGVICTDKTRQKMLMSLSTKMSLMAQEKTKGEHQAVSLLVADVLKAVESGLQTVSETDEEDEANAAARDESSWRRHITPDPSWRRQMTPDISGRTASFHTGPSQSRRVTDAVHAASSRLGLAALFRPPTWSPLAGVLLYDELDKSRAWREKVPRKLLSNLDLPDLDAITSPSCLAESRELVTSKAADPQLVRVACEAFLAIVRSEYWQQVDAGKFIAGSNHPDTLFMSIASGMQGAAGGLVDFQAICQHLKIKVKEPDDSTFLKVAQEEASNALTSRGNARGRRPSLSKQLTNCTIDTVQVVKQAVQMSDLLASKQKEEKSSLSCLQWLVRSSFFNAVVLVLVLLNCVFLFVEESCCGDDVQPEWRIIDGVMVLLLAVECGLQVLARGLAHLKQAWNVIDVALVFICTITITVEACWPDSEVASQGNLSTELLVIRVYRIFRLLKQSRPHRLVKMAQILESRFRKGDEVSVALTKSLRTLTILTAFITAHIRSQTVFAELIGNTPTCEQARCLVESVIVVNKALVLIAIEAQQLPKEVLEKLAVLRGGSQTLEDLLKFLVHAQHVGFLSEREADGMIEPLKASARQLRRQQHKVLMGLVKISPGRADSADAAVDRFLSLWRCSAWPEQTPKDPASPDLAECFHPIVAGSHSIIESRHQPEVEPDIADLPLLDGPSSALGPLQQVHESGGIPGASESDHDDLSTTLEEVHGPLAGLAAPGHGA